jgi:hypothetical protein
VKSHLVSRLRPGVHHREVGSWLQLVADPRLADPPFEPEVGDIFARHSTSVAIGHEHEPASTAGWGLEEQALGLARKFRAVAPTDRPFPPPLIADLRSAPPVERVEQSKLTSVTLPLASSLTRAPSEWTAEAVSLPEAHRSTRGGPTFTIAVLDTGIWPAHREDAIEVDVAVLTGPPCRAASTRPRAARQASTDARDGDPQRQPLYLAVRAAPIRAQARQDLTGEPTGRRAVVGPT